MESKECKNCHSLVNAKFCGNCGQSSNVRPLSFSSMAQHFSEGVLQVNHGLIYTIKELSLRPALSIRNYIGGARKRYIQPIAYAFTLASFYFVLSRLVEQSTFIGDALEGYRQAGVESQVDEYAVSVLTWLSKNYAITSVLLVPVYAFASRIVFYSEQRNYLEHVVLQLYITGHQALIYSFFAILSLLITSEDVISNSTLFGSMAFAIYVQVTFFANNSVIVRLIKSVSIYFIANLVLFLFGGFALWSILYWHSA